MRRKSDIRVRGLGHAFAGRGRPEDPWKFLLRFEHTEGLSSVRGREGVAYLSPAEVAAVLGAIPAVELDGDSLRALIILQEKLRMLDPFREAENWTDCPECGTEFGWNDEDGLEGQMCACGHMFGAGDLPSCPACGSAAPDCNPGCSAVPGNDRTV